MMALPPLDGRGDANAAPNAVQPNSTHGSAPPPSPAMTSPPGPVAVPRQVKKGRRPALGAMEPTRRKHAHPRTTVMAGLSEQAFHSLSPPRPNWACAACPTLRPPSLVAANLITFAVI